MNEEAESNSKFCNESDTRQHCGYLTSSFLLIWTKVGHFYVYVFISFKVQEKMLSPMASLF